MITRIQRVSRDILGSKDGNLSISIIDKEEDGGMMFFGNRVEALRQEPYGFFDGG